MPTCVPNAFCKRCPLNSLIYSLNNKTQIVHHANYKSQTDIF